MSYIDTLLYALERPKKETLYLQTLDDARIEIAREAEAQGNPFSKKTLKGFLTMRYEELVQKAQSREMTLRFFNKDSDRPNGRGTKPKKSKGQKKASRAAADVMAMSQMFEQRVRNAVADLWADDGDNADTQYHRGIFELGAMLTDRWDKWISGDAERADVRNWLLGRETVESTPKFPHPVLADVSEYLLKAEDRLNDLRDYDLDEDKFGVLDIETDVQTLVAKVQGILDAEEAHAESKQE